MVSDILFGAVMGTAQALSSKRDFEREVFAADRERAARMEELREQYRIQGENQLAVERERIKQQEMKQQAETGEKIAQLQNMFGSMFVNESPEVLKIMAEMAHNSGMSPSTLLQPGANVVTQNIRSSALRNPSISRKQQSAEQYEAPEYTGMPAPKRPGVVQSSIDKGADAEFRQETAAGLGVPVVSENDISDMGYGGKSYQGFPVVENQDQLSQETLSVIKTRVAEISDFWKELDVYGEAIKYVPSKDREGKYTFGGVPPQMVKTNINYFAEAFLKDATQYIYVEETGQRLWQDAPPVVNNSVVAEISKNAGVMLSILQKTKGTNDISGAVRTSIMAQLGEEALQVKRAITEDNPPTFQEIYGANPSALSLIERSLGFDADEKVVALYLSNFYQSPDDLKDPALSEKDPWNGAVEWAFKVRGITPGNQDAKKVVESSRAAAQAAQGQPAPTTAQGGEAEDPLWVKVARRMGVSVDEAKKVVGEEQAPAPQQQAPRLPERTADTLTGNTFETMRPALAKKMKVAPEDIVRIDASRKDRAVTVYLRDGTVKQFYARSK